MKNKETLEEAVERLYPFIDGEDELNNQISEGRSDFIQGAKWQAGRSYTELLEWLVSKDYLSDKVDVIKKEFEQFNK
jgi:hypothetical protein